MRTLFPAAAVLIVAVLSTSKPAKGVWSALFMAFVGLVISVRLKRHARWTVCFLLSSSMLLGGALCADETSYYEKMLAEKNIDADTDGLNAYLSGLHPNEQQRQRARQLIKALGATDSFAKREDAMAKIIILPTLPNEELLAASNGSDAEIRWRARHILKLGKPESDRVLHAALKTIEEKMLAGVTLELIRAIPLCDQPHLRYAARQALKASARPNDSALLRREMKNENVDVRIAVATALGKALKAKAADDLTNLLDDPEDRVKVAAARALADFGERRSLVALEKLLSSNDETVRTSSALALYALTGERFGFSAYETVDKRNEAIAKWRAWIAREGKTAKLSFPLRTFGTGVSYLKGSTLMAHGYKNKVVEFNPEWKEVWSYSVPGAFSAVKLINGNILIGCYASKQVIEVTPDKKVIWQMPVKSCINARPLDNGNVLIAGHVSNEVLEVTRDKNVVWKYSSDRPCYDAHRLNNGNTMISSNNSIIEVTPKGEKVWEYTSSQSHYGFQPLPNGNILLASTNEGAKEITRTKEVVWQHAASSAFDVFRLQNGNTLIMTDSKFFEVTREGKVLWSQTGNSYGRTRR